MPTVAESKATNGAVVLVTGANGFVGSALVPHLVRHGFKVVAAVRTTAAALELRQKLGPIGEHADVHEVGEIDGSTAWSDALRGVSIVVHLAARAHRVADTAMDPRSEFFRVNTHGTDALCRQAAESGVEHFVFMSSVGAMASSSDYPLDEAGSCRPESPYGESKLLAEEVVRDTAARSGMTYTILRPTLVYGPGNPGNMERLEKLISLGLPLPLGGVANLRSLLYVANLCDGIIACLATTESHNETFLISDRESISTPELIRLISDARERRVRLMDVPQWLLRMIGKVGDGAGRLSRRHVPATSDAVAKLTSSLAVDSSKIRRKLSWNPPFTTAEGIYRTFRR